MYSLGGSAGEPVGVLLRGAHPAHGGERCPLGAEEALGQLAQLLPGHLLIARQKLVCLPHPAVQKAGGAQVAHSGLNGLQTHQKTGLSLFPGAVQLLLGGAVLSQIADDVPNGFQGLGLLLAASGGIDAQQSGVRTV